MTNIGSVPPTGAKNPLFDDITFTLHVILFVTCLVENSIAVYILNKNMSNGRTTFAQFMLISIACADILTALIYYPAIIVQFSHGGFIWMVEGPAGDILCKLYNFLAQLPNKVLVLSLVALACDATRNSSSQGRKEHTKKFSIIVITFFWVTTAGISGIYLRISKVQTAFQFNECSTETTSQQTVIVLNLASIDMEFRKRYRQLSPAACCCFRRIPCHTVQEVRMRH